MKDLSCPLVRHTIYALSAFAFAQPVLAQHAGGAHEHGVAELSVATEGATLVIEIVSPLDNLVGFEHAPASAAQRRALATAEAQLRDAPGLFRLPAAAGCALAEVRIEGGWMGGAAAAKEQAARPAKAHEHGAASADEGGHADVMASYRFDCAQPQALDAIDTQLFAVFPRLREVRAARATAGGQGALVLRPGRTVLPL